jgi:hypothetical protein
MLAFLAMYIYKCNLKARLHKLTSFFKGQHSQMTLQPVKVRAKSTSKFF